MLLYRYWRTSSFFAECISKNCARIKSPWKVDDYDVCVKRNGIVIIILAIQRKSSPQSVSVLQFNNYIYRWCSGICFNLSMPSQHRVNECMTILCVVICVCAKECSRNCRERYLSLGHLCDVKKTMLDIAMCPMLNEPLRKEVICAQSIYSTHPSRRRCHHHHTIKLTLKYS